MSRFVIAAMLVAGTACWSFAADNGRRESEVEVIRGQIKELDYYTGPDHPTRRRLERRLQAALLHDSQPRKGGALQDDGHSESKLSMSTVLEYYANTIREEIEQKQRLMAPAHPEMQRLRAALYTAELKLREHDAQLQPAKQTKGEWPVRSVVEEFREEIAALRARVAELERREAPQTTFRIELTYTVAQALMDLILATPLKFQLNQFVAEPTGTNHTTMLEVKGKPSAVKVVSQICQLLELDKDSEQDAAGNKATAADRITDR